VVVEACGRGIAMYHQRRPEKTIADEQEMVEVIRGQKVMTLAMARDNEPYLVTVNYGFDEARRCFYFHCSLLGKKSDFLRASAVVWGQVLEDGGYMVGQCNHAFRTVQFQGRVEFLEDEAEKRRALSIMIEHLEPDPEPVKERLIKPDSLARVALARVHVEEMTAKRNPAGDA